MHEKLIQITGKEFRYTPTSTSETGLVESYYSEHEKHLCNKIQQADAIVGVVAWVTLSSMLQYISDLKIPACIVMQKEEALLNSSLFDCYEKTIRKVLIGELSFSLETGTNHLDVFRSCGYCPESGNSYGRCHTKDIIFLKRNGGVLAPYAKWSSSFNWTWNASNGFDSSVYIENSTHASDAFEKYFWHVYSVSEPREWRHRDPHPEFSKADIATRRFQFQCYIKAPGALYARIPGLKKISFLFRCSQESSRCLSCGAESCSAHLVNGRCVPCAVKERADVSVVCKLERR